MAVQDNDKYRDDFVNNFTVKDLQELELYQNLPEHKKFSIRNKIAELSEYNRHALLWFIANTTLLEIERTKISTEMFLNSTNKEFDAYAEANRLRSENELLKAELAKLRNNNG